MSCNGEKVTDVRLLTISIAGEHEIITMLATPDCFDLHSVSIYTERGKDVFPYSVYSSLTFYVLYIITTEHIRGRRQVCAWGC